MNTRLLLVPCASVLLIGLGAERVLRASPVEAAAAAMVEIELLRAANPPAAAGNLPAQWLAGNDCSQEGYFQVHQYNADTYIIRQSKCEIFEAPFLYMLFGEDRALLMDTGAVANAPIENVVGNVLNHWLAANGKDSIPLTVAHTHTHADHTAGDATLAAQGWVTKLVGTTQQEVEQTWGFQNYPHDRPSIDLGNRVIDVLGTPGHQAASLTLYDRNTQLLLTGDIVYPGHLFVFSQADWSDFVDSMRRLVRFATQNPVSHVLGCHIEFSNTPGQSYAWGNPVHPDEAPLQLTPVDLAKILLEAETMGSNPQCQIFDNFVIHPVYLCGIGWNG